MVPNVFNFKERKNFSTSERLEKAKGQPSSITVNTSVSNFYDRGKITRWLFGDHYRDVWYQQNEFNVFSGFDTLTFHKVGGGMQTTSLEFRNSKKESYSFRTLDKDQSKVLKGIWKYSAIRALVRDQTSALNPYNAKIVADLSSQLGIWHTAPEWYYIPYTAGNDSVNQHIAGRVVLLEEEPSSKWKRKKRFGFPLDVAQTDEILSGKMSIDALDTLQYLKCRLFDILISDWDRHSGQWKWVVKNQNNLVIAEPFPIDRDMAFGRFDDGVVNTIVVSMSNKFKSFRPSKESIIDAANKVTDLDELLLSKISEESFIKMSKDIQLALTDENVSEAFSLYPEPVFNSIGEDHITTLQLRLQHLSDAAVQFKKSIIEVKNTH